MDRLLERALAVPEDDTPRLVWADAVGGDRGTLVQLQCALSARRHSVAERRKLQIHQRQLLRLFGWKWSQLDGLATSCQFHRGFVVAATLSVRDALERGDELLERAPLLRALRVVGGADVSRADLERLLESPAVRQVAELWLPSFLDSVPANNLLGFELRGWGGDLAALLLRKNLTRRLRAFGIGHGLGAEGLGQLCESGALDDLEALRVDDSFADVSLPTFRKLESLAVRGPVLSPLNQLPDTVAHLSLDATEAVVTSLLSGSAAASLRSLVLRTDSIAAVAALSRFAALRSLSLSLWRADDDVVLRRAAIEALVHAPLDTLEELEVTNDLDVEEVRLLVERFGRQLHLLTLPGAWRALGDTAAYARSEGELRLHIEGHAEPPHVARTRFDSSLDHAVVRPPTRVAE